MYFTGVDGLEGGSRFARAKRFALRSSKPSNPLAKDDVDNVGAGRAAKGASPATSTTKPLSSSRLGVLYVFYGCGRT